MPSAYKRAYIAKLLLNKYKFSITETENGASVYKDRKCFSKGANAHEAISAAIDRLEHAGQINWDHLTINIY